METFPWTRVQGVEIPTGHKEPVPLIDRDELSLTRFRELMGDGSFGGDYERSADEMEHLWRVAVEETRARLTDGW